MRWILAEGHGRRTESDPLETVQDNRFTSIARTKRLEQSESTAPAKPQAAGTWGEDPKVVPKPKNPRNPTQNGDLTATSPSMATNSQGRLRLNSTEVTMPSLFRVCLDTDYIEQDPNLAREKTEFFRIEPATAGLRVYKMACSRNHAAQSTGQAAAVPVGRSPWPWPPVV